MANERERAVVASWVDRLERGDYTVLALSVWRDAAEVGWALMGALTEALEEEVGVRRMLVAAIMLALDAQHSRGLLSDEQTARARDLMRAGLKNEETSIVALGQFAFIVPVTALEVDSIRSYLESDADASRLAALVALARYIAEDEDDRAIDIVAISPAHLESRLLGFLDSINIGFAVCASIGLSHLGVALGRSVERLVATLGQASSDERMFVLWALGCVGRGSSVAQDAILKVLRTAEGAGDAFVAGYALGASMGDGDLDRLSDREVPAVEEASQGFTLGLADACVSGVAGTYSEVARRLWSEDQGERLIAANVLGHTHKVAARAWPDLMDRVGVELDFDVVQALAQAIGLAGVAAAPELLKKLTSRNIAAMNTSIMAFGLMGVDGATALVAAVRETRDSEVGAAISACFRDLGDAKIAVGEELGRLLVESADELTKYFVLTGLKALGPAARTATPQIIGAMLEHDGDVSDEAEAALCAIGHYATPHIVAAMRDAPAEHARHLSMLLGWIDAYDRKVWPKLEGLSAETLLAVLAAGEACQDLGRMSLRGMTDRLGELKRVGFVAKSRDHAWLTRQFGEVERHVTRGAKMRKGDQRGTRITKIGRKVLLQIRVYLYERGFVTRFRRN
ncbi:MAG: hypothetical protein AAF354_04040 [Pseudomonadota bacterium]